MVKLNTKLWKIDPYSVNEKDKIIIEIAAKLKDGQIIAFPTETVYGLGANAWNRHAVEKVFEAKGRPSDNPLILHIASIEQLSELVDNVDKTSKLLISNFWPGPLTIIFNRKERIASLDSAGLPTVAVRIPNNPIALAILKAAQVPIAAPSANLSGRPSPTTARHVLQDLDGLIDGVVDGGPTGVGVESTVIDLSGEIPTVLRPGGVTIEELEKVIGEIRLDPSLLKEGDKPRSPGMKYTHYAPKGEMWLIKGKSEQRLIEAVRQKIAEAALKGYKVGILTTKEFLGLFTNVKLSLAFGSKENLYPFAEHLYEALRNFDQENIDYIIAIGVEEQGIGLAIMNRMHKAAGGKVIDVG